MESLPDIGSMNAKRGRPSMRMTMEEKLDRKRQQKARHICRKRESTRSLSASGYSTERSYSRNIRSQAPSPISQNRNNLSEHSYTSDINSDIEGDDKRVVLYELSDRKRLITNIGLATLAKSSEVNILSSALSTSHIIQGERTPIYVYC